MNLTRITATKMNIKQPVKETTPKNLSMHGILNNLKNPSLGLVLFLLGMNGMYFLPFIFPQSIYEGAQSGIYRYYLLSWGLICGGGILDSLTSHFWFFRKKLFWTLILTVAITLTIILSVFDGEYYISVISKMMPFFWLLLVPSIGLKARNWSWLWTTILFHAVIGAVFAVYGTFSLSVISRDEIFNSESQNFYSTCLYMSGFIFMMIPVAKSRVFKLFFGIIFLLGLLQALVIANRYTWLLLPFNLITIIFIYLRDHRMSTIMKSAFILTVMASLFLLYGGSFNNTSRLSRFTSEIQRAYSSLVMRMTEKGSLQETIVQNERWLEIDEVVADMRHIGDWIIGKGLAARWSSPYFAGGDERWMVHNTWLNSIYWGGIFLALAISWPLFWAIHVFFRSKHAEALCFASFLLLFYATFPAYLRTTTSLGWVLFCLALGPCVKYELQLSNPIRLFKKKT